GTIEPYTASTIAHLRQSSFYFRAFTSEHLLQSIYYRVFTSEILLQRFYFRVFTSEILRPSFYYRAFTTELLLQSFTTELLLQSFYYRAFTTELLLQSFYYRAVIPNPRSSAAAQRRRMGAGEGAHSGWESTLRMLHLARGIPPASG